MKYWAVLLTVFNRKEKTLQCLSRLFDQLPVEDLQIDVFLTDDGCTDGTAEAVENLFPSVHLLKEAVICSGIAGCSWRGRQLQIREIMTLISG